MNTKNLSSSYDIVNEIKLNSVWTGGASEANVNSLNSLMTDLSKCISDITAFDGILELKDKYIDICD